MVIWSHTHSLEAPNGWNPGRFGNIAFFLTSGIFFKLTDFRTFITKKLRMLLVPFLFFYVFSIPFRMVVHFWDCRTLAGFHWEHVMSVFSIVDRSDYLALNVPLWFLMAILVIQLIAYVAFRLPRPAIAVLACLSFYFQPELAAWPTIFMFNNALCWFGFFALGYLLGRPLLKALGGKRERVRVIGVLAATFAVTFLWVDLFDLPDHRTLVQYVREISLTGLLLGLFSYLNGLPSLAMLRFLGTNSLILLGTHLWVLVPMTRVVNKFDAGNPAVGFALSLLTALILTPAIVWMGRHIPLLVGKEPMGSAIQATRQGL